MTRHHKQNHATLAPAKQSATRSYTCAWCGQPGEGTAQTCSNCGAAVDVRLIVPASGWYQMPPVRRMSRLQFGNSQCQIEGMYMPVADMKLAAGDSVYFFYTLLLWKGLHVKMRLVKTPGFYGLQMLMARADGPGNIAFSGDEAGEVCALTLEPGYPVDVNDTSFMVATANVRYEWFSTNIWFTTTDVLKPEIYYPMGRFITRYQTDDKPGLVVLHGTGNVFVRRLEAEETILVKPSALLFKDASVSMQLHFEEPEGNLSKPGPIFRNKFWNRRYIWLRMSGPGSVAIQSAYPPVEDDGNTIGNTTTKSW